MISRLLISGLLLVLGFAGCVPRQVVLPARVVLTVQNDTSTTICDVQMRPSEHFAAGWGTDWMDRNELIPPGGERSFKVVPNASTDLRVVSCAGTPLAETTGEVFTSDKVLPVSKLKSSP